MPSMGYSITNCCVCKYSVNAINSAGSFVHCQETNTVSHINAAVERQTGARTDLFERQMEVQEFAQRYPRI